VDGTFQLIGRVKIKVKWNPGLTIGGGTLHCEPKSRVLVRIASTHTFV